MDNLIHLIYDFEFAYFFSFSECYFIVTRDTQREAPHPPMAKDYYTYNVLLLVSIGYFHLTLKIR